MPVFDLKSKFKTDRFDEFVKEAKEKNWTIKAEKVRAKRSMSQNNYYWAILAIYGIKAGYTPDELHTDLRRDYGLFYSKNGKKYLKSTSTLNTKEMSTYTEWIRHQAGQQGFELPDPDYLKEHWKEFEAWKDEQKQFIGESNGN